MIRPTPVFAANISAQFLATLLPTRSLKKTCAGQVPTALSPTVRTVVALLSFLSCLTSLSAQWTVTLHEGRRYVPIQDVASFYRLDAPAINGNEFTLTGQQRTIRGRSGGREVIINNVKYVLCFPIVSKGGGLFISAMDVTKIIEPVMRPGKIQNATAVRTVILDAGHGGHDSGATGPWGAEKAAALDVVLRARKLLQESGYNVRLTRGTDVFIPLEKRPSLANKYPNAIFISVHFNKSKSVGGTGIETYALAPRGVPSMDEENLSYSDLKQYPGHDRDSENIALATAMHSSMLRHLRLFDRGIKRARFLVIRDITIPGVLLEGGFMNHPVDGRQISQNFFRDAFARAILEGVNRYQMAVSGQMQYFRPSAVIGATDATSAPILKKPPATPAPVGSKTDSDSSVARAVDAMSPPSSN
ncbi:MAG: N-acetylmuramoyl-L-alanine amidase [Terrimicrobiaceae bacterium]|jgi:N-acetylmuramoyl-L-alanine amidase